jgi:hypothetical protein
MTYNYYFEASTLSITPPKQLMFKERHKCNKNKYIIHYVPKVKIRTVASFEHSNNITIKYG